MDPIPVIIPAALDGKRLDAALACLTDFSRATIKRLLEEGAISPPHKPTHPVRTGTSYTLTPPPPAPWHIEAQAMPLDIVYEDTMLLVLNKPAGLVVHPGAGHDSNTLVSGLLHHCGGQLSGIGGVERPGIVHRLDKDTSGLMVVAKTDAAHQGLAAQFADRSLSRDYAALCWGHPPATTGTINAPIGRNPRNRQKMAVTTNGRDARTTYTLQSRFTHASLVHCHLHTGRTHQIRVHMQHIGCPLVGDPLYGRRNTATMPDLLRHFPRQALHAFALRFQHPQTGALCTFSAPIPEDIQTLLQDDQL